MIGTMFISNLVGSSITPSSFWFEYFFDIVTHSQ